VHVVATAGHVDHGKSMLVRALTGMEPDRWAEEQRRGMTIDLGFAWMTLPSGEQIAFVDVPGHERFVSNMLAGAGPAPAVMFVVAADEGWMPQSAEHLAAIDALGVRHGILVVTRADLADPAPALGEAARQIAATSLGPDTEAVAVSALDGRGLPDLIDALTRLAGRLPRPDPRSGVRLWLDRVFAIKGSGTVVTGTLQAGTVRAGDELILTPAMRPLRIRGVQSLGAAAGQVSGVARVALNLRGVSTRELSRGMALVQPGTWTLTSLIDIRLGPPPRPASGQEQRTRLSPELTLHIGAARTVARVRVLGTSIARLSLAQALPLHVGDRVLLRDPGAAAGRASGQPIYGATVLDVMPPRLRGSGAAAAAQRELASWPEPPAVRDLLRRHRLLRARSASAMGLCDLPPPVSGDWLTDPEHWQRLRRLLVRAVAAHAASDPLAAGLPVDAARAELGLPDRGLVEALAAGQPGDGAAEPLELAGGYLRRGGARGTQPAQVPDAVRVILADLADAPFRAPDAARLQELGLDNRAAAAAERAGLLLRLPGNIILAAGAADQAARILARLPQPFTAAEARQALETTRRVAIPLLEHLDRAGVTRRLPDDRRVMREPSGSRH
jgi:selenocysteine-specific elongation factor